MGARRMSIPLWLGYGGAFLVAWFFSAGIFAQFPLMGSVPDLVPVCIAFVAVLEGGFAGGVAGLILGLFCWLTLGESTMIFLGAAIGLLSGMYRPRLHYWLCCMFFGLLALAAVNGVRLLAGGGSFAVMLHIAGWEMVYSILLAPLFYPLFRLTHRHLGNG